MSLQSGGSSLLLGLPEDVSALIAQSLSPKDICSISLCCKYPGLFLVSDEVWLAQCEKLAVVTLRELLEWRRGVSSYKNLCRFLVSVKRLIGIWLSKEPDLGNVVYVLPGFVSVVGCRIIPQTVNPLGIEDGHFLWTPVFEVIGDFDGSTTFFLHGKDEGVDYLYPGIVKSLENSCNVLLLEVDTTGLKKSEKMSGSDLYNESEWILGSDENTIPFNELVFEDRDELIQSVTTHARFKVLDGPLFPPLSEDIERDMVLLSDRRDVLLQNHKLGGFLIEGEADSEAEPNLCTSGDTLRLILHGSAEELRYYRAYPSMDDSCFALYKVPSVIPREDQEYAGLWGGTYGWPAQNSSPEPLFLVVISYEDLEDGRHIFATKILEGSYYVRRPSGSTMFSANIDKPGEYQRRQAMDKFPWDIGADSLPVIVEDSFKGSGIADGYGFRYPGSTPGSLYVIQNGILAFVWKKSQEILTLRRLDLPQLLRNGKRLPALPPAQNFSYMDRSYNNVFIDT